MSPAWKALPLLATLALTACGGSGGGSSDASDSANTNNSAEKGANGNSGSNNTDGPAPKPDPKPPATLRFIVLGDSGTGSPGQYAVGEAIAAVCNHKGGMDEASPSAGCHMAVGLGDNIYESGTKDIYDPQFVEKFEKPFEPVQLPFYMVLGNHDNTGYVGGDGVNNDRGDSQVDYHYFDGRMSDRWKMPDRYYQHTPQPRTRDGRPLVDFFGLDSNPISGGFADPDLSYAYHTYGIDQLNWLIGHLAVSDAVFKIAMAHHPYITNGAHGNAGSYYGVPKEILPHIAGTDWKRFMEEGVCDQTDFFLAGHEHDLEVIHAKPDQCGRTEFLISGAAGKTREMGDESRNPARFQHGGDYGFMWLEAREAPPGTSLPAQMCVEVYVVKPDRDGLGVMNGTDDLTPAFTHCYEKKSKHNIQPGTGFSGQPTREGSRALPLEALPLPEDFNPNFEGPLKDLRAILRSAFTNAVSEEKGLNLSHEQRQTTEQLIANMDVFMNALDALVTATVDGDNSTMIQMTAAILTAAEELRAIDTTHLPAPFDQLHGAALALSEGIGNHTPSNGTDEERSDLSYLVGPLVQFSFNLSEMLDAIGDDMPKEVSVIAGVVKIMATTTQGLAQTIGHLDALSFRITADVIIGTLKDTLDTLLTDVLWLNKLPLAGPALQTVTGALVTVLGIALKEISSVLDNVSSVPVDLLETILQPVTRLLREALDLIL